ncbi:MAG TPA: TonB-dependent receptor [Flammeovirgaceae bacterium]|nr:TonB-dependent receptor [Flammeovirgaceae bacterium]
MMDERKLTVKEKALRINLDRSIYGSFAEIGAGQEVAANFFRAGGASGTVAKTMSAYDMTVSDAIYGKVGRYVCEERLLAMLDREYELLASRLKFRAKDTTFFSFANTMEAINYARTNRGHGWIGFRFQLCPEAPTNQCVIHIMMNDKDPNLQQEVVGIIGVNMIYACLYFTDPEEILCSLVDNMWPGRVEIDMFRLEGPDFTHVDNRLMSLKLVKNGMTRAAMFGPEGNVLQPSEALYKKNVLVLRGRFRPVTHVNVDMLFAGLKLFKREPDVVKENIMVLTELTLHDLEADGSIDEQDFLNRVDLLCSLGQNVLISNYQEYYRLVRHLTRLNRDYKIGLILGMSNLRSIFDEKYYTNLKGGILEAFGILFGRNVKLYIYPTLKPGTDDEIIGLDDFELPDRQKSLLQYLIDNDKLAAVRNVEPKNLHIISDNVLEMIRNQENGWEKMVPHKVATLIKEKGLFHYRPKAKDEAKSTTGS